MKSYCYLWLLISLFIQFFKGNLIEANLKRDSETISLVLTKFQDQPITYQVIDFSFYTLKFDKFNFYPPITTDMIVAQRGTGNHQIKASNFILSFFSNLVLHLKSTTKVINENDFIIELNVTDSGFQRGATLDQLMRLENLKDYVLSYSDQRNFLVSKRFKREFEEDLSAHMQFDQMIKVIFQSCNDILKSYNYPQVDFLNINNKVKSIKKTVDKEVNSTLILNNYLYTSYNIPDGKIIQGKLNACNYNVSISYYLTVNGVKDTTSRSLVINLPLFYYAYGNVEFNDPLFIISDKIKEVSWLLFESFKADFLMQYSSYFDSLKK